MYEFLTDNSLYLALFIAMICWLGIYFYIFRLDKKIKKLERLMKNKV